MFQVTKSPNRLDIELDGKLDADEMKTALDQLISESEDIENGKMLYRIHDIDFPTLGALGVEFSRLPALFKMIGKFDRAAVLTDVKWVQTASEIEGVLIPGLEIKAFNADDEKAAETWLAG